MQNPTVSAALVKKVLLVAGLMGFAGIVIGSFTAHGLEDWLVDRGYEEVALKRVDQADTGVQYHLLHSVALLAIAGASGFYGPRQFLTIVILLTAGIVLFSGSLYLLVALNLPVMGAITPLGGLSWIAAWLVIAWPRKTSAY